MSALLRSCDMKDFAVLGQDGHSVNSVATQLRDAIRFRLSKQDAEYLAIPQRNDKGSIIDWYVPFDSDCSDGSYFIIPWTSATDEEKRQALVELDSFKEKIYQFGKNLAQREGLKGDNLLFSRLLYMENEPETEQLKAIRFPNKEYIYLVNDRPVITGWGFLDKNCAAYADPFLQLRSPIQAPVTTESIIPSVKSIPAVTESVKKKHCYCCYSWWLPLLLALLAFLIYFFWPFLSSLFGLHVTLPNFNQDTHISPSMLNVKKEQCVHYMMPDNTLRDKNGALVVDSKSCDVIVKEKDKLPFRWEGNRWVDTNGKPITDKEVLDNLTNNQVLPAGIEGEKILGKPTALDQGEAANQSTDKPTAEEKSMQAPAVSHQSDTQLNERAKDQNDQPTSTAAPLKSVKGDKDSGRTPIANNGKLMQLDPKVLQSGDTQFLNGDWSTGAGIQDKSTGQPLKLRYKFNNGEGAVQLKRGDGVICSAPVKASVNEGSLSISNNGLATCSDGSTYQLPQVACNPDASGKADCRGSYGNQTFLMLMKSNE